MNLLRAVGTLFGSIGRFFVRLITRNMPIEHRVEEAQRVQNEKVKRMAHGEASLKDTVEALIAVIATQKTAVARLSKEVDRYLDKAEAARVAKDETAAKAYEAQAAEAEAEFQRLNAELAEDQRELEQTQGENKNFALFVDRESSRQSRMQITGQFVIAKAGQRAIHEERARTMEDMLGLTDAGDTGVETMEQLKIEVAKRTNRAKNYADVLGRLAAQRGVDLGSSAAQGDPDVMNSLAARRSKLGIKFADSQQNAAGS